MSKVRHVVAYKHYFQDFLLQQPRKTQDKIFKAIEVIETIPRVPSHILKSVRGTKGLYEIRVRLGSDIWRIFCFFEDAKLVVLLTGFVKKNQKTPKIEINRAVRLMELYFQEGGFK